MAMVQNQWYHFGMGAPSIVVYFSGDGDVHWGHGVLTHSHMMAQETESRLIIQLLPPWTPGLDTFRDQLSGIQTLLGLPIEDPDSPLDTPEGFWRLKTWLFEGPK